MSLLHITLADVELLCACADARTLSDVATKMNRSVSTISVRLAELEEKFGFKIAERYPLELTPRGGAVAKRASEVKAALAQLIAEVEQAAIIQADETPTSIDLNSVTDPEIIKVILAMQSTDEDGRLRMRLAANDALTLHQALQRLKQLN